MKTMMASMAVIRGATKNPAQPIRGIVKTTLVMLVCVVCSVMSSASFSHQQKIAVTRILFNENSGNIEVMHRFFIHDAEHAASVVFGESQNLIESAISRELFSSYVVNRFAVIAEDEQGASSELELKYVGEEIDGQFLWVYQEVTQDSKIKALSVVHLVLRDVWFDQNNLVNVEKDGEVYSVAFTGSEDSLRIEF